MARAGDVTSWRGTIRGTPEALFEKAIKLQAAGRFFTYQGPGLAGGLAVLHIPDEAKRERPLCGAKTRVGGECQAKAVTGGKRCRMHGGLSTGPKTAAGRAKIAESNRRRVERVDQLMREIKEMQG